MHDLDRVSSGRGQASGDSGVREEQDTAVDSAGPGTNGGKDGPLKDGLPESQARLDCQNGSGDSGSSSNPPICPPCTLAADAAPTGEDTRAPGGAADVWQDLAKGTVLDTGSLPDPDRKDAAVDGASQGSGGDANGKSTPLVADDLPDIDNSPVRGVISFIPNSGWGIDGVQWPAFEIHTPTASYWLLKSQAAIVSILDSTQLQWINFSSGYRPNRGVPNLGACCQVKSTDNSAPTMSTVLDPSMTVTSTHVRFISKSADESTWLVWDFFLTHFTLTINRAAKPFGFTYRGVPGGSIGLLDQVVYSDGTVQSALLPRNRDLSGPAEWAYFAHLTNMHSLFLIQHSDDSLAEPYRIADSDTAMFTFGSGQISQTPIRFSLGLIDSCDAQTVRKRIEFVRDAIR